MAFTPLPALAGGIVIGLSAAALLLGGGRIAGISGMAADAFARPDEGVRWRLWFLAGLIGGGTLFAALAPGAFERVEASGPLLALAGLLVGAGTRLGGGCTSGHGVCGIGRGSWRSLVATLVFMATGAATVLALRLAGGALR